jgi:hypothetical protein
MITKYKWYKVTDCKKDNPPTMQYPGTYVGSRVFSTDQSLKKLILYNSSYLAEDVLSAEPIDFKELDVVMLKQVIKHTVTNHENVLNSIILNYATEKLEKNETYKFYKQQESVFFKACNFTINLHSNLNAFVKLNEEDRIFAKNLPVDLLTKVKIDLIRNINRVDLDSNQLKILFFELTKNIDYQHGYKISEAELPIRLVDHKNFCKNTECIFSENIMYVPEMFAPRVNSFTEECFFSFKNVDETGFLIYNQK